MLCDGGVKADMVFFAGYTVGSYLSALEAFAWTRYTNRRLLYLLCYGVENFNKYFVNRFEIEKKLREAKRKENRRGKVAQAAAVTASQRSKDRRKVMEDKKDNKMSALQDLKARREEKKKQGESSVS